MNLITSALTSGFTQKQIIDYFIRKFPQYKDKIQAAVSMGFTPNQILKFVGGGRQEVNKREIGSLTEHERTKQSEAQRKSNINQTAMGIAGTALGAYGLPAILGALNKSANSQIQTPGPFAGPLSQTPIRTGPAALPAPQPPQTITDQPSPMPPIGPRGGAGVPQPVNVSKAPGLPPANKLATPQVAQSPASEPVTQGPVKPESGAILDNLGIRLKIEKMRHQGHEPNTIIQAAEKMIPKELKGQFPVKEVVADYLSKPPETALGKLPEGKGINYKGLLEPFEDKPVRPEDYQRKPDDVKPLDKGALVLTPNGKVSEVKAKGPTGLIVDEGGKGTKHQEADLEQEPEDVIDIVNNILKIPEVDRSSVVSLFTYDPEDQQMIIQFHTGESFKYYGMPPEEVKEIAEKNGTPVTEGKNVFGAWSPEDKKSLGAALIQRVINNPKYKKPKKGEPPNPNYKKLDTLYDFYEKLRKKPKRKS